MSEYQPGDRVAVEGRVLHQTSDGWPMVERLSDGALLGFIDPAHLRLLDRPTPPLPVLRDLPAAARWHRPGRLSRRHRRARQGGAR